METTLILREVSKRFRRLHRNAPRTLKELVLRGFKWGASGERFWALQDISFALRPGQALGVIGANGSGKTTLLHLIAGGLQPDGGSVQVRGRIGALVDLGSGFHPDMTGRENVFVAGIVAGLRRYEVEERFDSIVAFAELGHAIDSPYRTYSSGMQMRLAFSVAIHAAPDVLLVDEVLAVGDMTFQEKCMERVMELRSSGCTLVIVSHALEKIIQVCDEALWLREGGICARGAPREVVDRYRRAMSVETGRRTPEDALVCTATSGVALVPGENRFGSQEIEIIGVQLLDTHGQRTTRIPSGAPLGIEIGYRAPRRIDAPVFGVSVSSKTVEDCIDVSTESAGCELPGLEGEGRVRLIIDRLDLPGGEYAVSVGIYEKGWQYAYDYHWKAYPFVVESKLNARGILVPPHRWSLRPNGPQD